MTTVSVLKLSLEILGDLIEVWMLIMKMAIMMNMAMMTKMAMMMIFKY